VAISLDPAEVAAALERVYARPEFAERSPGPIRQQLLDWSAAIQSWITSILGRLDFVQGLSAEIVRLLLYLVLLLGAGYAIHLMIRTLRPLRSRALAAPDPGVVGVENDEVDWVEAARRAEAEGRWRDAAFALYNGVVHRLAERGAVRLGPGKTPGDYRREARSDPEVRPHFETFVRLFLPIAFGSRDPAPGSVQELWAVAGRIEGHA
jgi:hypothetical protein